MPVSIPVLQRESVSTSRGKPEKQGYAPGWPQQFSLSLSSFPTFFLHNIPQLSATHHDLAKAYLVDVI